MASSEPKAGFSFHVVGTIERLASGRLTIGLPVSSLPWRDLKLIERHGRRRQPYGCEVDDPLARAQLTLESPEEVEERTGVVGAQRLSLEAGLATLTADVGSPVNVPCLRVANRVAVPVVVRVEAKLEDETAVVHVTQLSGGQRIGGVALKLRRDQENPDEKSRPVTASRWRAKVDPRLAAAYDRAAAQAKLETAVGVLIQAAAATDASLPGLTMGAQAGKVATATLVLAHLPSIAAVETISYIELASDLMGDAP